MELKDNDLNSFFTKKIKKEKNSINFYRKKPFIPFYIFFLEEN